MRPALVASACPNRNAATMLITRPIKVRAFGEMRVSARPCTIRSRSQPQARPNALVQVMLTSLLLCAGLGLFFVFAHLIVDGGQLQNLEFALPVRRDHGRNVSDPLTHDS